MLACKVEAAMVQQVVNTMEWNGSQSHKFKSHQSYGTSGYVQLLSTPGSNCSSNWILLNVLSATQCNLQMIKLCGKQRHMPKVLKCVYVIRVYCALGLGYVNIFIIYM